METSPIDAAGGAFAGPAEAAISDASTALGRDEFLLLLVAKLENQDPLKPAEDTEFISQLATFSSLEQLINVNDNLESMELSQAQLQSQLIDAQALDLIGKQALVPTNDQATFVNGQSDSLLFQLPRAASEATLSLMSGAEKIASYDLGAQPGEHVELDWDSHMEDLPDGIPDGNYKIVVNAKDLSGDSMVVPTYRSLPIEGVSFFGGELALISGGREIPLNSILEIRMGR